VTIDFYNSISKLAVTEHWCTILHQIDLQRMKTTNLIKKQPVQPAESLNQLSNLVDLKNDQKKPRILLTEEAKPASI